ncbi:hypothetical protein EHP00_1357 [Ecytonucleospora hepatopenaei]|uniref:Uncharacterized protein n=1 Tax=Ecytonucleospora hepatopenaei TaxID=646526 RepID=A0A1W0E338_9MICR|nr:hypothetical protein EHP00_1357 [Ecytonucleospora hepatopenaei]
MRKITIFYIHVNFKLCVPVNFAIKSNTCFFILIVQFKRIDRAITISIKARKFTTTFTIFGKNMRKNTLLKFFHKGLKI